MIKISSHYTLNPSEQFGPAFFYKLVPKVFGQLHPNDAEHLTKYLQNASKIRVKVVDTVPKHLSADNTDVAYISVWVKS